MTKSARRENCESGVVIHDILDSESERLASAVGESIFLLVELNESQSWDLDPLLWVFSAKHQALTTGHHYNVLYLTVI